MTAKNPINQENPEPKEMKTYTTASGVNIIVPADAPIPEGTSDFAQKHGGTNAVEDTAKKEDGTKTVISPELEEPASKAAPADPMVKKTKEQ